MGMFSWYRADNTNKQTNLVEGDAFKVLIPKEFGGGFIKGHYSGYGDCIVDATEDENGNPKLSYDVYELLAFWNEEAIKHKFDNDSKFHIFNEAYDLTLHFEGERPLVPHETVHTRHNRSLGIDIGCYDEQMANLKYPLKLVSVRYKGTYEDCQNFSHSDPDQGFWRKYN